MNSNISLCCLSLLLLLNLMGAKPVSNLQLMGDRKHMKNIITAHAELSDSESFKQLFEEDRNTAPYSSEETEAEGKDGNAVFLFAAPEQQRRDSDSSSWSPATRQNVVSRLLGDIVRKRSWSRYKKGGLRSCFGVRLERIGSFSGLGC